MERNGDSGGVSFAAPPVQEVAFAAQFPDPLIDFEQLVRIDAVLRPDFPLTQLQPQLDRMWLDHPPLRVRIGMPFPRVWWLSGDGHFVMQVQEDRVAFNWRKLDRPVDYPRFATLLPLFRQKLDAILAILGERAQVDLAELTYVNDLAPLGVDKLDHGLAGAIRHVAAVGGAFLPRASGERWGARWEVSDEEGQLRGYLESTSDPVGPAQTLTMTCRLASDSGLMNLSKFLEAIELAHEWIVRGFADITTDSMQLNWGRQP